MATTTNTGPEEALYLAQTLRLCELLSFFECRSIPKSLLSRACSARPEWTQAGELQYRLPEAALVPEWLVSLFDGLRPSGLTRAADVGGLFDPIKLALERGMIIVEGAGHSECYTVCEVWRDRLRDDIPSAKVELILFDILAVVIQAFPEVCAEILWEEMEFQLWSVVESTCLPFLAVLHIDDLFRYLSSKSRVPKDSFLVCLLKFTLRLSTLLDRNMPPAVSALIPHIIKLIQEHGQVSPSELRYLQLVCAVEGEIEKLKLDPYLVRQLRDLGHCKDERSNGFLGFALNSLLPRFKLPHFEVASSRIRLVSWWSPLSKENPSTMETLALSKLLGGAVSKDSFGTSWEKLALETKVLVGFDAAYNKAYEAAREILGQNIMDVKTLYGVDSVEFIITAAELVNCCNAISEEGEGEAWGRLAFNEKAVTGSAYGTYLAIAMADSFIGQSDYYEAENLLMKILRDSSAPSIIIMTTALRLSKMSRRQGKEWLTFDIWDTLKMAVGHFENVSSLLKQEYLEETLCVLSTLDQEDNVQVSRAREIVDALIAYGIGTCKRLLVTNSYLEYHFQELRRYSENLKLFSVSGPPLYYCRKIRDRFPSAMTSVIERLGVTCWQRYERVKEILESAKERNEDIFADKAEVTDVPMLYDTATSNFYDSGLGSSIQVSKCATSQAFNNPGPSSFIQRESEHAIPPAPGYAGYPPFHPVQTEPKYAASQASYSSFMSFEAGFAQLPPEPPEISLGKPFVCFICWKPIQDMRNKAQWKHHIFSDLRPYVCIIENCDTKLTTFASRSEFATHLLTTHAFTQVWACHVCGQTNENILVIRDHVRGEHGITIDDENLSTTISEKRIPRNLAEQQCPLCSKVPGSSQFMGHLCHHLEELSLAAIPQEAGSDSEFDESRSARSSTESSLMPVESAPAILTSLLRLQASTSRGRSGAPSPESMEERNSAQGE